MNDPLHIALAVIVGLVALYWLVCVLAVFALLVSEKDTSTLRAAVSAGFNSFDKAIVYGTALAMIVAATAGISEVLTMMGYREELARAD